MIISNNENQEFYMLFVDGKSVPTHKHVTLFEAEQEADRLIQKTQQTVYILKAIKAYKTVQNYKVVELESVDNSEPEPNNEPPIALYDDKV